MKKDFKLPTKSDLKGRSSTISNAFTIAITPYIYPSKEEIDGFYRKLQITKGQCAYCLGKANAMDHIKPLVTNGLPTGYITEIHNLVPCCSACNSSKGKKEFVDWYKSDNNKERLMDEGLTEDDIEKRYEIILEYIKEIGEPINYSEILGSDLWKEFLERKQAMLDSLKDNQKFCDELCKIIAHKLHQGESKK